MKRAKNKTLQKQIIIHGYKYQWNQTNWNNTSCDIEHLICCIVITSTGRLIRTVRKKLKKNNTKEVLLEGISSITTLSIPHSKNRYHARTDLYQLSHLSTRWIPTENQSCCQLSAWPLNSSDFCCLHPVWQMVPLLSCFWFFCAGNRFKRGKTNSK